MFVKMREDWTVWHTQIASVRPCASERHACITVGTVETHTTHDYVELMVRLAELEHPCAKGFYIR